MALLALGGGAAAASASAPPAHLSGHAHGTWQAKASNPDVGTQRLLRGHGQFTIGAAKVRGSVTAPGFISSGGCAVTLKLLTPTGSVTLGGKSKSTTPPAKCIGPFTFRYHTVSSSGSLKGAKYTGRGRLDLVAKSSSSTSGGTFTLRLRSS
jgi:hypothetical protein